MDLTQKGNEALRLKKPARYLIAYTLICGEDSIHDYVLRGVCYDVAIFIRALLDPNDRPTDKSDFSGNNNDISINHICKKGFSYWRSGNFIHIGSAVLFEKSHTKEVFHAAISCGGNYIRGENGKFLGFGWADRVNFTDVLIPTIDNPYKYTYKHETFKTKIPDEAKISIRIIC